MSTPELDIPVETMWFGHRPGGREWFEDQLAQARAAGARDGEVRAIVAREHEIRSAAERHGALSVEDWMAAVSHVTTGQPPAHIIGAVQEMRNNEKRRRETYIGIPVGSYDTWRRDRVAESAQGLQQVEQNLAMLRAALADAERFREETGAFVDPAGVEHIRRGIAAYEGQLPQLGMELQRREANLAAIEAARPQPLLLAPITVEPTEPAAIAIAAANGRKDNCPGCNGNRIAIDTALQTAVQAIPGMRTGIAPALAAPAIAAAAAPAIAPATAPAPATAAIATQQRDRPFPWILLVAAGFLVYLIAKD